MTRPTEGWKSLVDMLRSRAMEKRDAVAFTYLLDGECDEARRTYHQLDLRARAIGAALREMSQPGDRALLLIAPGIDFLDGFYGCVYAGLVAVPAYPPLSDRPLDTLEGIAADCEATIILTTSALAPSLEANLASLRSVGTMRLALVDRVADDQAAGWTDPQLGVKDPAILQFTSGSTSAPRGVNLSHANLLFNSELIRSGFRNHASSIGLIWTPPYHDMGLIGGIIQPVYSGSSSVLMSPLDFLQRPLRWLEAVSRYKATVSGGPSFAYEICIQKSTSEERARLDLESWELAFVGAEPTRPDTLDRFVEAFGPCGFRRESFYSCYGLAEATLIASGGTGGAAPLVKELDVSWLELDRARPPSDSSAPSRRVVGCGRSFAGQQIAIVSASTKRRCASGQIGEIWLAGDSVAEGYWRRPELTEATFAAFTSDTGEGPFLRTGDTGFLEDGELYVTGRLKDLIIISGRNVYPQDVERTVEASDPRLRPGCSAAFSVDEDGVETLVVLAEIRRGATLSGPDAVDVAGMVRSARRAVVLHHGVGPRTVLVLRPGSVAKTSSGKISHYRCREAYLSGRLEDLTVVGGRSA